MQAIVLTRRIVRETDERITLFTNELGKIEALARGSKKIANSNTRHGRDEGLAGSELADSGCQRFT